MGESLTKFLGCLRTREALVAANCCGADQSAWKGTASQTGERRTGATRPGVWQSLADLAWTRRGNHLIGNSLCFILLLSHSLLLYCRFGVLEMHDRRCRAGRSGRWGPCRGLRAEGWHWGWYPTRGENFGVFWEGCECEMAHVE